MVAKMANKANKLVQTEQRHAAQKQRDLALVQNNKGMDFDNLIHEKKRLAIVSALAVHRKLSFNDLKSLLGLSDGNLSTHARKLEEAEYVSCSKGFEGRIPKTDYQLTARGRKALQKYLAHMEALISALKPG